MSEPRTFIPAHTGVEEFCTRCQKIQQVRLRVMVDSLDRFAECRECGQVVDYDFDDDNQRG